MTFSPVVRRAVDLALCLVAPLGLGLAVCAGAYAEPRWWQLPALPRNAAAGLTLAANTAALMCFCALATPTRRACYRVVMGIAGSFAVVSVMAGSAAPGVWLPAHGLLAVTAAAVLAARSVADRLWPHPLDAAGLTLIAVVAVLGGALALGPALPPVPVWLIDTLLRANPAVAVTATAGVDLLHSDLFYRLAPVAHWQFEYPATGESLALFGGAAAAMALLSRAGRPGPPAARRILRPEDHHL
ncbi:MAG: hypothetical protein AB7I25_08035 [Vicinamibacterales bacterium]